MARLSKARERFYRGGRTVYEHVESRRRSVTDNIGTCGTMSRHYVTDVCNKIVSQVLSVYEYDSIRFYIKTMKINARFSRTFIVRIIGFYAVTEDCVVLDAETINGELQGSF